MVKNWEHHMVMALKGILPKKYLDGTYIMYRTETDDFTEEDMNPDFYYVSDALPSQLSCVYAQTNKKYRLTAGELTTISMIESAQEYEVSSLDVIEILLIAYFHDMDPILKRYLPGKSMGNIHRRVTNISKYLKRRAEMGEICYWDKRQKKYLMLDKTAQKQIEDEISAMSDAQRIETFDSENAQLLADHICHVLSLAFDDKILSLKTFSEDACFRAAEAMEE